ncbi:MAG: nucleotide sugar dehydrogenase, partial [Dokdonia sp.]|nr:nucleotide sugar dehydrogenase [Dokdonia sp.]
DVTIYDPWANPEEVQHEYGLKTLTEIPNEKFDAIVHAVAHKEFKTLDLENLRADDCVIYDVKGVLEGNINGKL